MNICVIIPVYNEEQEIGHVVARLKKKNIDVIVVNDGSSDNSKSIAEENGAEIVMHSEKRGKGLSLRHGFDLALTKGYDGIITMDGDGQHDVDDIDAFIEKANDVNNACVITGTRMSNPKGMPLIRLWTNKVMSWMISSMCKQNIPDTQCGYRFISSEILRSIKLSSSDFQIESELLIQASRSGISIYSIPIKTIYCDELSKINPFLDTVRFFVFIIKMLFRQKS